MLKVELNHIYITLVIIVKS